MSLTATNTERNFKKSACIAINQYTRPDSHEESQL